MTDLSAEEIRGVWRGQVQPVSAELLPPGLPPATREFLTTIGFPTVPVLDYTFFRDDRLSALIRRGGHEYLVFAENTSNSVFGVELESEAVYRMHRAYPEDQRDFYNSNIALFVYFHGLLDKNVLSLDEVNEQLLVDAVNSVRVPLAERDPGALSDDAPWRWTLSDLETEWQ
ncbi:SUKH-4 family immunity protein [Nocardia pneumoniae]|uniref:SUKH-4 family immunity protein n=1 Tax=Nocardia pneumoniae TaxID=228601 RepID=UPI0002FB79CA|nr:SUKH-4 family immunity protein [Nocardia pneumoniae]